MSVAETEDLISVLDSDVIDLNVLVSSLQEENAQLQQVVNLLLQRMTTVEAALNTTNSTLDGMISLFCSIQNFISFTQP